MGRRRHKNTSDAQRDDSNIATDSEVLRSFIQKPKPYAPLVPSLPKPLTLLEDRRAWHPENKQNRNPGALQRSNTTLRIRGDAGTAKAKTSSGPLPRTVGFEQPKGVAICVRRNVRRQVLFASKNGIRKGAGAKHRRRTQWSDVKC